jgi:hypothetical protein
MGHRAWIIAFSEFVSHPVHLEGVYATASRERSCRRLERILGHVQAFDQFPAAADPAPRLMQVPDFALSASSRGRLRLHACLCRRCIVPLGDAPLAYPESGEEEVSRRCGLHPPFPTT